MDAIISRIIRFYKESTSNYQWFPEGIWGSITQSMHHGFIDSLTSEDESRVYEAMEHWVSVYGRMFSLPNSAGYESTEFKNSIARLARRIGILPIHNPEQTSPGGNWELKDIHDTVKRIERELGFSLSVPDMIDLKCGEVGIPLKFIEYCGAVFTILSLLHGQRPRDIIEIGGGIGELLIIATKLGCKSYTDIDLPHIAAVSAYSASRMIGPDNVWLYGEPGPVKFARFYPACMYEDAKQFKYDLAYNSDSLPEMTIHERKKYIEFISECLSPGGFFLSVNHESDVSGQGRVLDAVRANGKLRLLSRGEFMLRPGYIEESYSRL